MKKTAVYALILSAVSVAAGLVAGSALERANVQKHLEAIRQAHPFSREMRQQQHKAGGGPKELFQRLAKDLNLDEGQKQEFKAILEKAREDISSISEGSREKLLAIRKESDERILGILTPEQQEKFKKIVAEAKKNHPKALQRLGQRFAGQQPRPGSPEEYGPAGAPNEPPPPPPGADQELPPPPPPPEEE